jgi:predicted DsbA family dithiol-disulfide isomerase
VVAAKATGPHLSRRQAVQRAGNRARLTASNRRRVSWPNPPFPPWAVIAERVAAAAAIEGLPFAIDKISRQPNTLDCHRLILWSRSATDPGEMKQRLMELYFAEGADLSDPKTLIRAAVDCGMDGDLVRRLLASDADVDRVENEANSAKEAGIDGVPCFIFGGSVIVTGAQSPEYLANAIQRIAGQHTRLRA